MDARLDNNYGTILIPVEVLADIAGIIATKCYGVVGMASRNAKDGIVNLIRKDNLNKGVKVKVDSNTLIIDIHIVVEYGVNISVICQNITNDVQYHVEKMTGFKVKKINLNVESIRVG